MSNSDKNQEQRIQASLEEDNSDDDSDTLSEDKPSLKEDPERAHQGGIKVMAITKCSHLNRKHYAKVNRSPY
jgi:hypothetical protein